MAVTGTQIKQLGIVAGTMGGGLLATHRLVRPAMAASVERDVKDDSIQQLNDRFFAVQPWAQASNVLALPMLAGTGMLAGSLTQVVSARAGVAGAALAAASAVGWGMLEGHQDGVLAEYHRRISEYPWPEST